MLNQTVWRLQVCALMVLAPHGSSAWAQTSPSMVVSGVEQGARDDERLRLLRDELERETRMADGHTKRKAERLAANDPRGVEESEQALSRHAQNIQSLQRELDLAVRQAGATRTARSAPRAVTATRRPAPVTTVAGPSEAAPWWDVYGRAPRRTETPALPGRDGAPGAATPGVTWHVERARQATFNANDTKNRIE